MRRELKEATSYVHMVPPLCLIYAIEGKLNGVNHFRT